MTPLRLTKKFFAVTVILTSLQAQAAGPFTLPVLDPTQIDSLLKTVASDMVFRPVQGADTFGNIFGLALGVTGQLTSTGSISNIISTSNGGTPFIMAADINAALQLPMGIGIETGFLPSMNLSGTTMNRFGANLKWTMTKTVLSMLPFSMALRGLYTTAGIAYTQPVTGGTVNVNYSSNMYGATLMVSKSLVVVEPYISYGLVSHNSTISGTGTATLFGGTFPVGTTSASGSGTGGMFEVGLEFKLAVLNIGVEYGSLFGNDTYAARVGFKF